MLSSRAEHFRRAHRVHAGEAVVIGRNRAPFARGGKRDLAAQQPSVARHERAVIASLVLLPDRPLAANRPSVVPKLVFAHADRFEPVKLQLIGGERAGFVGAEHGRHC